MTDKHNIPPRYRLQRYLAAGYALFIAYVSLTPFTGWQEQGLSFMDVLTAPVLQTFTWFDFSLNCLSYTPFGFVIAYMLRGKRPVMQALLLSALTGLALSVTMEYAQMYLPSRVSSNSDLLSNTMGTLCGAALALLITKHAWFSHIKVLHNTFFKHGQMSDFGLALILLWIFAQINPSLPMLGSVFVTTVARWPFDIVPEAPFNWVECSAVALNLLMLGILLLSLLRERRHTINVMLLV